MAFKSEVWCFFSYFWRINQFFLLNISGPLDLIWGLIRLASWWWNSFILAELLSLSVYYIRCKTMLDVPLWFWMRLCCQLLLYSLWGKEWFVGNGANLILWEIIHDLHNYARSLIRLRPNFILLISWQSIFFLMFELRKGLKGKWIRFILFHNGH